MTDIYIFKQDPTKMPENAAELLPRWRRRRYERLRYTPARQESLGAGLLWRYAVERRGLSPDEPVKFLQAGKPVFADREGVHFSLSHSGPYAMCAVSDQPVGVDVQKVKSVHLSIARRFHFRERDWLAEQPAERQMEAFFRIWTRKEAWVKAVSRDQLLSLEQEDVMHGPPGWQYGEYELEDDFLAAVCARQSETLAPLVTLEPEQLLSVLNGTTAQ